MPPESILFHCFRGNKISKILYNLALIKSISGIRGEIGGKPGENLTPLDIVECTAGYGHWLLQNSGSNKVVIGRDARISGAMVQALVTNTLIMMGINVVDLGLSTTPTVEIAVPEAHAGGGIILTASHNPRQWNALKFLNEKGEFISGEDGNEILKFIAERSFDFADVDSLGTYEADDTFIKKHISKIIRLPIIQEQAVQEKRFKVVVDCINSTGAISIAPLLDKLRCEYILINEEMNGEFAHNPEPLAQHLTQICEAVVNHKADLGIVVDPDVDRLAFISEDGSLFGEEYTLVAIADFILAQTPGNTVSNLSSTRALRDLTNRYENSAYHASAVGEVNVVKKMKEVNAVIGGEGNGGIIYPELHYGRDALVGIAMFLSLLAERGVKASELKASYPAYLMAKEKIQLTPDMDIPHILRSVQEKFSDEDLNLVDGLKIDFNEGWVHLRKSNTEPIIRIYAEALDEASLRKLINSVRQEVDSLTV